MSDDNTTVHTLVDTNATTAASDAPKTATKPIKIPKKRGRKGDKLKKAFLEIPSEKVDLEQYAEQHGVSAKSLRQIKRHDLYKSLGQVYVRKDKDTKKMQIWRDTSKQG